MTLVEIVSSIPNGQFLDLPLTLQIAGSFAMLILHFHYTPWLSKEESKSEDVKLFS